MKNNIIPRSILDWAVAKHYHEGDLRAYYMALARRRYIRSGYLNGWQHLATLRYKELMLKRMREINYQAPIARNES